jgi:uncharacterized phiE125 gp8 family phage protein
MVIEHASDDTLIESYLKAAISSLDPQHGILGRAMITQTLIAYMRKFDGDTIDLPYPPLISVSSVKYQDDDGVEQTVDASTYEVITSSEPGKIALLDGEDWPTDLDEIEFPIWITYITGYAAAANVPEGIKLYIKMLVAEMYRQREISTLIATKNNQLWMNFIDRYRFRFSGWEK